MKQIILFVLVSFVFPEIASSQIELNSSGNVGIGGVAPSSLYTLRVDGGNKTGLYVITDDFGSSDYLAGTRTLSYDGLYNYGLVSYGFDGVNNYGIYTYAVKATGTTIAYGIYAKVDKADSGETSYAGYFDDVGSGSSITSYAGYFDGNVTVMGNFDNPSDEKLKENIAPLDGAAFVQRLMQLRPVSFTFKKSPEFASINLSDGIQYGLTAQEVETVFPEFVSDNVHPGATNEAGEHVEEPTQFKAISYMKFIPLLLSAIQEQQAEIDALKSALGANGIKVNR